MCGITGSSDFEKAYTLYRLNLPRGNYSSGMMAVDTKTGANFIYKQKNPFEDKEKDSFLWKIKESRNNYDYFLFHSRAPTNSTETSWSAETTHPFECGKYYVAHNGIITNFLSFEESKHLKVDSQIISEHLNKSQNIIETLSRYEGLFTCWIVLENKIQLVKAGSSLWMLEDSFSSFKFDNAHYIEEDGVVFDYINKKFEKSGTFPYTSTYFI